MESPKACKEVCRTCLKTVDEMISVFEDVDLWSINIAGMLKECTSIEILVTDSFSKLVCRVCLEQVKCSYRFKQQCQLSQTTLKNIQQNSRNTTLETAQVNISIKNNQLNDENPQIICSDVTDFKFIQEVNIPINHKQLNEENTKRVCSDATNYKYIQDSDGKGNYEDVSTCQPDHSTTNLNEDPIGKCPLNKREIKCKDCDNCFNTKLAFRYHVKQEHNKVKCHVCNKSCHSGLNKHILLFHKYHCKTCLQIFSNKNKLDTHCKQHTNPDSFECNLCSKILSSRHCLREHLKTHSGEKPYLCTVCGKTFTLRGNLNVHVRLHTGFKPYSCYVCDRRFTQWSTLRSHLLTHTNEKSYKCTKCDKSFSRKLGLTNHQVVHSESRTFLCTFCPKSFKTAGALRRHRVVHTGETNYSCTVCGKCFNRSSTLSAHRRIHTGERPHKCVICGRGFTQFHVLQSHLKTHQSKLK